jgi:putative ABC transport system ATP-binding protein
MISLVRVTKTYAVDGGHDLRALDEVSLDIPRHARVAIMGPSGSGKSTMLHLIGGLDRPTSGVLTVDGTEIAALGGNALAAYRRTVGFVFQRFNLIPTLNVLDNVIAPVVPYRTSFYKRARGMDLLDQVGLADRARSLPSRLSGGQQQRVAIARALINSPALILADEPTGALDSDTGAEIIDLILGLEATTLIATHDHGVAACCERLIRMRDGTVLDPAGTPAPDQATAVRVQSPG